MVFQDVVRSGVKVRARVVARYRVRAGVWLWCALGLGLFVTYFAAYGYVYHLSRVRHQLLVQRDRQREAFFVGQGRVEALRSPLRIQREVEMLGMVPLTMPEGLKGKSIVVAARE